MLYSTRSKLVFSFISVALLVGMVSLMVGWQLLYDSVLNEANNRIRQDLNVARVIYDDRVAAIQLSLETVGGAGDFNRAVENFDPNMLKSRIKQVALGLNLDFAGLFMSDDRFFCCVGCDSTLIPRTGIPLASMAQKQRRTVSGTMVLELSVPETQKRELVIASAVPIWRKGEVMGVLYGGMRLGRDESIVDKIKGTVFRNEIYQGRNVGTATIFFNDLRISTTVLEKDGRRAIGTRASKEVTQRVLVEGKNWTDRAFVVNDWYITAYEPIIDVNQNRVGMLYVGVLEAPYRDVRQNAIWVFATIILTGVMFAIILGTILANRIMRPVNQLIQASMEISQGNLSPDMGPDCQGDIGLLQTEFKKMTQALVRRDKAHIEESERQLIQSEKQATIGKLAAGVAHEINNPLTPILTFTHLILRRKDLPEGVSQDLETIAFQTERVRKIVKGLLDFSRQSRLDRQFLDPGLMLEACIHLMENQALIHGVTLKYTAFGALPFSKLDRDQIQSVMVNMILNSLDATRPGGTIDIRSKPSHKDQKPGIEICVQDTGTGIHPEHMDKLFDPFFTTKEVGEGTGLGLAVSAGIIERHGGKICVESEPGKGSLFTIWLPCDRDAISNTQRGPS